MPKVTQPVCVTPKSHFPPEGRPGVGGQRKRAMALHSISAIQAASWRPCACRLQKDLGLASSLFPGSQAGTGSLCASCCPTLPPSFLSFLLIFFLPFY